MGEDLCRHVTCHTSVWSISVYHNISNIESLFSTRLAACSASADKPQNNVVESAVSGPVARISNKSNRPTADRKEKFFHSRFLERATAHREEKGKLAANAIKR